MEYKGIDKEKILEVKKVKLHNTDAYAMFTEKELENLCKNTDAFERLHDQIELQHKARKNDTEMAIICEMAMMYLDSLKDKKTADKEAYNKGLNDAWVLISNIYALNHTERERVFGYREIKNILDKVAPFLAMEKFEAYKKEQAEIKVGDIVYNDDTMENGIVTYIADDEVFMLYDDGSCGLVKGNLTKTGKHIDIQKILDELKEGV